MTFFSLISGPSSSNGEADFGRTFVLGSDPLKLKLKRDVELAFAAGKKYFEEKSDIVSSQLFDYAYSLAGEVRLGVWRSHRGTLDWSVSS